MAQNSDGSTPATPAMARWTRERLLKVGAAGGLSLVLLVAGAWHALGLYLEWHRVQPDPPPPAWTVDDVPAPIADVKTNGYAALAASYGPDASIEIPGIADAITDAVDRDVADAERMAALRTHMPTLVATLETHAPDLAAAKVAFAQPRFAEACRVTVPEEACPSLLVYQLGMLALADSLRHLDAGEGPAAAAGARKVLAAMDDLGASTAHVTTTMMSAFQRVLSLGIFGLGLRVPGSPWGRARRRASARP